MGQDLSCARSHDRLCALKVLPSDGDPTRFEREALAVVDPSPRCRSLRRPTERRRTGARYIDDGVAGRCGPREAPRSRGRSPSPGFSRSPKSRRTLCAAHERGIVHRDLKPANLFLVGGRLDAVKLLDFGIARSTESTHVTLSGVVIGTPLYMAPEQVRGTTIDARTDVYGVGAVMFRCLTGHPPFSGDHQLAVLAKIVLDSAPSLRSLRPDAPVALEALLARLLAKEPGERPADGAALVDALRSLAGAPAPVVAAVTERERRVASLVLCARAVDEENDAPRARRCRPRRRIALVRRGAWAASSTRSPGAPGS